MAWTWTRCPKTTRNSAGGYWVVPTNAIIMRYCRDGQYVTRGRGRVKVNASAVWQPDPLRERPSGLFTHHTCIAPSFTAGEKGPALKYGASIVWRSDRTQVRLTEGHTRFPASAPHRPRGKDYGSGQFDRVTSIIGLRERPSGLFTHHTCIAPSFTAGEKGPALKYGETSYRIAFTKPLSPAVLRNGRQADVCLCVAPTTL